MSSDARGMLGVHLEHTSSLHCRTHEQGPGSKVSVPFLGMLVFQVTSWYQQSPNRQQSLRLLSSPPEDALWMPGPWPRFWSSGWAGSRVPERAGR